MTETIKFPKCSLEQISEKEFPIRVGYYAMKHMAAEYKEKTGESISMELIMTNDFTAMEPLLYYSLQLGHKLENKPFEIEREMADVLLDLVFTEFAEIVNNAFPSEKISEPATPEKSGEQKNNEPIG